MTNSLSGQARRRAASYDPPIYSDLAAGPPVLLPPSAPPVPADDIFFITINDLPDPFELRSFCACALGESGTGCMRRGRGRSPRRPSTSRRGGDGRDDGSGGDDGGGSDGPPPPASPKNAGFALSAPPGRPESLEGGRP